jgi:flagellar motor switch protein FliM
MKPERRIVAERPLARHCAELLKPAPAGADLQPAMAIAG